MEDGMGRQHGSVVTAGREVGVFAAGRRDIPHQHHAIGLGGTCLAPSQIDVEGMELQVLPGLRRAIATWRPPIFIEVENRLALPAEA